MGEQLKYGWIRGGELSVPVTVTASQTIYAQSGRFVYLDTSAGTATIADDGANEIFGHLEMQQGTSSSTAGGDGKMKCIIDPTAVFRVPVAAGTYVQAMQGDTCDILIDANGIQGADLTAATDNVLIVVDGDLVNNAWVDVMINQNERGQRGVTT